MYVDQKLSCVVCWVEEIVVCLEVEVAWRSGKVVVVMVEAITLFVYVF
jgi:hypothetical protein